MSYDEYYLAGSTGARRYDIVSISIYIFKYIGSDRDRHTRLYATCAQPQVELYTVESRDEIL